MTFVRKRVPWFDGKQVGHVDLSVIMTWLETLGYPPLYGNFHKPEDLTDRLGNKGVPGFYIEPVFGRLCIRTVKTTIKFDTNDWILYMSDGDIRRVTKTEFDSGYEIVPED